MSLFGMSDDALGRLSANAWTTLTYLRTPALVTSGVAALLSGLLYVKQNEIIYPRNVPAGARTEIPRPKDFGYLDYEELQIGTPDGETLAAYLIKPPSASAQRQRDLSRPPITIITFHGNAGNIGHRVPIAIKLQDEIGCNVLMVEYRGYGASTGRPDERGLLIDGQAALDYVRARPDLAAGKIVVYGQSLGGAVAIQLVAGNRGRGGGRTGDGDGRIAGLILENTFTSIRKLIPSVFPPARFIAGLCHQIWPSETVLATITDVPILFLSGLEDEIVPPSHMHDLYRICRAPKVWKTFPRGKHNDTVLQPGFFAAIAHFLRHEVARA
ncbi:MAG: hypothetical protein M1826_006266 [Phylliscum demangeonii]|nr:MAG: hypothetical protein M1826_006266 [Phylliscum demangeonii]